MDTAEGTGYEPHVLHEHLHQRTDTQPPPEQQPHSAEPDARQKHYRPRQCRICFEIVQPTTRIPLESIPGFLQPGPQIVYEDDDGRLIRPCRCKGSSQYVHENCLTLWRMRDPHNPRNFYHCPTCGFQYRLSRLGWAGLFSSLFARSALTIGILAIAAFTLGFVADPVIRFALDPMSAVAEQFIEGSDDLFMDNDGPVTWSEHFLSGFASIGLLSFLKVFLSNPLNWIHRWVPGGYRAQRGTSGRERISQYTWILIVLGVVMFVVGIWQVVQKWSAHMLRQVEQKVLDVHDHEDESDEDEE